jgi:ribosomal protein S18 acetylase RimI-like enzyme
MEDTAIAIATPEMARTGSELSVLSGPELMQAVFGPNAQLFWEKAFSYERCCFSYQHSIFIQANGEVAGLAVVYDSADKKKEELRSYLIILRHLKLTFFRQFFSIWRSGRILAKIQEKDHYLSNLAVYPKYRSLGYGAKLMAAIEQLAKEAGSKRMVLDTEMHKDRTIQFYKRCGYEIEAKTPMLKTREGNFEFYRMFKYL